MSQAEAIEAAVMRCRAAASASAEAARAVAGLAGGSEEGALALAIDASASAFNGSAATRPARSLCAFVKARAVSESNRHEGLAIGPRHARKKHAQTQVVVSLARVFVDSGLRRPSGPVLVTMTRREPSAVDPDNLPGCFKHHVDAAARYLGLDDADPRIAFVFRQEKCSSGAEGVSITVEWSFGGRGE